MTTYLPPRAGLRLAAGSILLILAAGCSSSTGSTADSSAPTGATGSASPSAPSPTSSAGVGSPSESGTPGAGGTDVAGQAQALDALRTCLQQAGVNPPTTNDAVQFVKDLQARKDPQVTTALVTCTQRLGKDLAGVLASATASS
jgi:hypothetical protein